MQTISIIYIISECQTDVEQEWKTVEELEHKINRLEAYKCSKAAAAEFDVRVLMESDKWAWFCTGLPTYSSFMHLVEYLEPKAKSLIPWNGSLTQCHSENSCAFRNISVANQLFSVMIRLRLRLVLTDVCFRFSISEATYSRLFSTWICFFGKRAEVVISLSNS